MAVAPRFLPCRGESRSRVWGAWASGECETHAQSLVFRLGGYVEKVRELRHKGAERDRVRGGGVTLPLRMGSGEGAVPPPQKIFDLLMSKSVSYTHLTLPTIYSV